MHAGPSCSAAPQAYYSPCRRARRLAHSSSLTRSLGKRDGGWEQRRDAFRPSYRPPNIDAWPIHFLSVPCLHTPHRRSDVSIGTRAIGVRRNPGPCSLVSSLSFRFAAEPLSASAWPSDHFKRRGRFQGAALTAMLFSFPQYDTTELPFSSSFLYYWRGIPPTFNPVGTTLLEFPVSKA